MKNDSSADPAGAPARSGTSPRPFALLGWVTAIMATLLVAGELFSIDAGLTVALSGAMHLSHIAEYSVAGLGAAAALWALYCFFSAAIRYERSSRASF
jgi:hypothetical protein